LDAKPLIKIFGIGRRLGRGSEDFVSSWSRRFRGSDKRCYANGNLL